MFIKRQAMWNIVVVVDSRPNICSGTSLSSHLHAVDERHTATVRLLVRSHMPHSNKDNHFNLQANLMKLFRCHDILWAFRIIQSAQYFATRWPFNTLNNLIIWSKCYRFFFFVVLTHSLTISGRVHLVVWPFAKRYHCTLCNKCVKWHKAIFFYKTILI